jgi:hypothetical protein
LCDTGFLPGRLSDEEIERFALHYGADMYSVLRVLEDTLASSKQGGRVLES